MVWRPQVPVYRSAKVTLPEALWWDPTAVQAVPDVHDTPFRTVAVPPTGFAVGWMVQVVPFHRSDKVRRMPDRPAEYPAAVQAEGAVQSTPIRKFCPHRFRGRRYPHLDRAVHRGDVQLTNDRS